MVEYLPHVNAALNGVATVLLVTGYLQIRAGRERAHRNIMLACFAVSVLFLISYGIYHFHVPSKRFPASAPSAARAVYYTILLTHVVLAAAVPFLAVATLYLGLRNRRAAHRRLARWTFPIWLYVSVTGVIVYWMLYQLFASVDRAAMIELSQATLKCWPSGLLHASAI